MRTTEEVLTEAFRTVKAEGAQTMPNRAWVEPQLRRRTPRFALALGVVATALGLVVMPGLVTGDTEPAIGDEASGPPTVASIEFVSNDDLQPNIEGYSETGAFWSADWKTVDDVLAATGKTFDAYPTRVTDVAVLDGRAVVTGDATTDGHTAIWYSDGGSWTQATITYPESVALGDGGATVQNGLYVAGSYDSLFAWGNLVDGNKGAGAIVLTSDDGATWTASVHDNLIGGVVAWKDGFLVAVNGPMRDRANPNYIAENGMPASLTWTSNHADWYTIEDLGDGEALDMVLDGSTIYVLLHTAVSERTGELFVAVIETE